MQELKDRLATLRATHKARLNQLHESREAFLASEQVVQQLTKVHKVLSHLMDNMATKDMQEMDRLVTFGLNTVFGGLGLEFKTEVKDSGKKLSISMTTLKEGEEVADDAKGSITVVQSLLLRMMCILKLNKPKIMLLDETFGAIDQTYINDLGPLISDLCSKMGFDVILVTHNPGAADTQVLWVDLKDGELKIKGGRDAQGVHNRKEEG